MGFCKGYILFTIAIVLFMGLYFPESSGEEAHKLYIRWEKGWNNVGS